MGDLSRKEIERRVKHRDPLKELDLTGMKLDDFNFEGASFTKCKFTGSSFKGSIISFSRFDDCLLDECEIQNCNVHPQRIKLIYNAIELKKSQKVFQKNISDNSLGVQCRN